jgi:hypothetical protein
VRRAGEEPPGPISIDEDNRFLIDRLLNERISKKKIKYLVKWVGYPDHDNTWKPLQNLNNCEIYGILEGIQKLRRHLI